jgi:beta-glucanase (GH16 family)
MTLAKRTFPQAVILSTFAMASGLGGGAGGGAAGLAWGQDLMRDDFSGSSLNSSIWGIGTWTLDRTRLGITPQITGGLARLRLDTYNPNNPGGSFLGTEIWSNTQYDRGTDGLELEARVRVNSVPDGVVTSFFLYGARLQFSPPLADEIDFEHVSKMHNPAPAGSKPILLTTWNDYRTDGSNFGDPNVHNSLSVVAPGVDLAQFNTYRMRWLGNRVEWYVNGRLLRTTGQAVSTDPMNVRLNFWAPSATWGAAYSAALQPTNLPSSNQSWFYDVDFVSVRRAYKPIAAAGPNRVLTDRFKNANVANTDTASGFWTQRNQGTASVLETSGDPLKLTVSGAGFPHAQVVSAVRGDLNFFRSPLRLTIDGIEFASTSNSFAKSILRFSLSPQSLAAGNESEYTVEDAFSLRIQGDNQVALGFKVNQTNANSEFNNLLMSATLPGPVRRVVLTLSPNAYQMTVEHETSLTDGTRQSATYSGSFTLNLSDWRVGTASAATGNSALVVQGQFNNAGGGETMTTALDSLSVDMVRSIWNVNAAGLWTGASNWTSDGVPDSAGANVLFGNAISAPRTVTLGTAVRAGVLQFDSASRYTLAGGVGSSLTLQSPNTNAELTVISGAHTVSAPLVLASPTRAVIATGSTLTLGQVTSTNASAGLTFTGPGRLEAQRLQLPSLSVSGGVLALLPAGAAAPATVVDALAITGGLVDMGDNELVIRGGSVSAVRALVASWWNAGARNGSGLGTSLSAPGGITTLAVRGNATLFGWAEFAVFAGVNVTTADVLVMYTYLGDVNLDGRIDASDINGVLNGWTNNLTGWQNGDTNYDGVVNGADYSNLLLALAGQGAPLGWDDGPGASIPEPAALGPMGAALLLSCLRRRRA